MPYCHPTPQPHSCRICARYVRDPAFRRVIDAAPPPGTVAATAPALPAPLPCEHLGPAVRGERAPDATRDWRECGHPEQPLGAVVCGCRGCGPRCRGYQPEGLPEPVFAPKPTDVPCGVVIGSYKWPELIELQLRLVRHTCGPVPVLVSSDHPESVAAIDAICDRDPDCLHLPNPDRIGHTGGDLAAFSKGIMWAASRGLRVVAKLSQRFLAVQPRWLQEGATELLASTLPLATRRCRGREVFPLRTEAALLDVPRWNTPQVLRQIRPGRYWQTKPGGRNAEMVVAETLAAELGGLYWPWSLITEDRYQPVPGAVWHCSHATSAYHDLAARFGVRLPGDFHNEGWQRDRDKGQYAYG